MATVTAGYTWTSGETVTPTKLNSAATPTVTLADGEVTNAKVASGLDASKLTTGTLPAARIADASLPTTKLAAGALPTNVTVSSANIDNLSIVNADVASAAAIDLGKLATGALPTAITVASANLVDGTIVNADINASADIADTKLATISTAGKVSNSATTATNANTANAIVARDASGNFSAGTITAALTGSVTGNVTGNLTGNLTGTASAIADGSVSTAKIVDANVTNAKLASDIDASKLTTGTLPIARIADDAVTDAKLSLAANAGEVKKALNADNSPPIFACRAWVNFDGTKDTTGAVSTANTNRLLRGSGNVASVLRNGVGDYTITFTTAMPDANYAIALATHEGTVTTARGSSGVTIGHLTTPAAGSFNINCRIGSTSGADGVPDDPPTVTASIFR
jgi:hypothetical protein